MHSKIFQISSKPIYEIDYIIADNYFDWFVPSIADYTDDLNEEEVKNCIDWFINIYLKDIVTCEDGKITIINKEKYFEKKYTKFKDKINALQNTTFKQFIGEEMSNLHMDIMSAKAAYIDEYSIYIDDNGEYSGLETLDEFMRRSKNGDVFYIGNVIDYHF